MIAFISLAHRALHHQCLTWRHALMIRSGTCIWLASPSAALAPLEHFVIRFGACILLAYPVTTRLPALLHALHVSLRAPLDGRSAQHMQQAFTYHHSLLRLVLPPPSRLLMVSWPPPHHFVTTAPQSSPHQRHLHASEVPPPAPPSHLNTRLSSTALPPPLAPYPPLDRRIRHTCSSQLLLRRRLVHAPYWVSLSLFAACGYLVLLFLCPSHQGLLDTVLPPSPYSTVLPATLVLLPGMLITRNGHVGDMWCSLQITQQFWDVSCRAMLCVFWI